MPASNNPDEAQRAANATAHQEELEAMKQWAKETRVNAPIPQDLLPILSKDPIKQMELAMAHVELGKGEMAKWARETKVNAPIPLDLLPILARDPAKQMELARAHGDMGKKG